jgi:hypothetical protein
LSSDVGEAEEVCYETLNELGRNDVVAVDGHHAPVEPAGDCDRAVVVEL